MQGNHVMLGGLEPVYMQKLALYLRGRFGSGVQVGVLTQAKPEEFRYPHTVWIGSEAFLKGVRDEQEEACCILLSEESEEEGIFRYQSCEKLYQKIVAKDWSMEGLCAGEAGKETAAWMTVTTDQSTAVMVAFSLLGAQCLGEKHTVLLLNLSECSGMESLLGIGEGTDLADLMLAVREEKEVCLDAFVRRMGRIDCICPPANPMILHELREQDIAKLIRTIDQKGRYSHVIVALGNTCCGCQRLIRRSGRTFHLTGEGALSACSRMEWTAFIRLCNEGNEQNYKEIIVSDLPAESLSEGVLEEWQSTPLGQLARRCMEEDV